MKALKIILVPTTLLLFAVLFCVSGVYTFSYQEMLGTYYAIPALIVSTLAHPGGAAQVVSAWLTQYFANPYAGVAIMTALLTAASVVCASLVGKVGGRVSLAPLGILPAVPMALLNYNVGYDNAGTVAFLLMLCVLSLMLWVDGRQRLPLWAKTVTAVALTAALSIAAGAVAMLCGVLLCVCVVVRKPLHAPGYLLCPLAAWLLAVVYVHCGYFSDMTKAVTPEMYYTMRLNPGMFVYMPWIMALAVFAVAAVTSQVRKRGGMKTTVTVWALCFAGVAAYASVGSISYVDHRNETFKQLMYYSGRGDWQSIIDRCGSLRMDNLIHQNLLNMALAEQGLLGDRLFDHPCYDIRSIYIEGEKTPYMQMLLSDVYYSMGHIALAQRNAFEANESLDNLSPRLLMRLAQTNLIFGHYRAAEKYINLLEHTRNYREEARRMRQMLDNDDAVAADPQLGPKRRCLYDDNRFSAYRGLDDDLKQILRGNPGHSATLQYLGALYLLTKDLPKLDDVVNEFCVVDSVPRPLPEYFAQGMLMRYRDNADSVARRHGIQPRTVESFNAAGRGASPQPGTFWYFYRFQN